MVAEMTIPPMEIKIYEMTTIVALKNTYALTINSYDLAIVENGTPDTWGIGKQGDPAGLSNLNSMFSQYFKVTKNCGTGPGCFADDTYQNLKGLDNFTSINQDTNYTKFILANGASLGVTQLSENCNSVWGASPALQNVCGMFVVDVNNIKQPNQYGQDVFGFAFTKYGIVPLGTPQQTAYPFNGFCSIDSNANKTYENGLSCTAWVMYNENMEYQNCTGLNWKGKDQCKK